MIFTIAQSITDAKEILTIKEVTIIGVSFAINIVMGFVVRYLYLKVSKLQDQRLEDHKEFTKEILNITEKTSNTVQQVNDILRFKQQESQNVQ